MPNLSGNPNWNAADKITAAKLNAIQDAGGLAYRGTTAPTDTSCLWIDTSVTPNLFKYHNGSGWVAVNKYA